MGSYGSQGVGVHINNDSSECDIIDVLCHIGLLGSWIHWLIGGSKGWWGSYVLLGKQWFSGVVFYINNDSECDIIDVLCHFGSYGLFGSLVDRGFQGLVGFIGMTWEAMVLRGLVFT